MSRDRQLQVRGEIRGLPRRRNPLQRFSLGSTRRCDRQRRLDFSGSTGVAVGAMVTDDLGEVSELIRRMFENRMVYYLEQSSLGTFV